MLDEPDDSFTKLLAELSLEIEDEKCPLPLQEEELETDIGFEDALDVISLDRENGDHHLHSPSSVECELAETPRCDKYDVRTDHLTSTLGGEEVSTPRSFSSTKQEVPESVAGLEPEEFTLGISLPTADHVGLAEYKGEEEILYSDIVTPASEGALAVDNEDVQRFMNLGEIFSFHKFEEDEEEIFPVSSSIATGYNNDGTTEQDASSRAVMQDIIHQMMTDETFPIYDDDVADALSHNGNEFLPTPESELMNQLQTGKEECFQLGRGDYSPTLEDRKENSEDKIYFHPVRLPCHDESEDAHLPTESRLSSSWQQEAASPHSERCAERRPTKRIRTALSPAIKPTRYQNSRMRAFNREFGYKTRKHPFACCQSDIRRWIPSDNRKNFRPLQEPTGSSNDHSPGTELESYALHIEQLSSIGSPTDAQHPRQQPCHSMLDTLTGDSRKDVTCVVQQSCYRYRR